MSDTETAAPPSDADELDQGPEALKERRLAAAAAGQPKQGQRAEVSNLDIVRHYFDQAVDHLQLPDDIRVVFWKPYREVTVQIPVKLSDGKTPRLLRLPDPAQRRPRPVQGRRPLPPGGRHRRGPRPRLADDLEDRRRRRSLRRRQGRRQLPGRRPQPGRAPDDHALASSTRSTRCSARPATSRRPTSTPTPRRWPG